MSIFASLDAWVSLLTLTFLEIVLGIDNIIFISMIANKLPQHLKSKVTNLGLLFAMFQRIILLVFVSYLIALKKPFFSIETSFFTTHINGQSVILLFGGIFLLYKSVTEIYEKVENKTPLNSSLPSRKVKSFTNGIVQILIIDFIFSIDSILTAVGMVNGISDSQLHSLILMSTAVIVSIIVMMLFANPIRKFIERHPSIQLLGLSFLVLIGFLLITEAGHLSQTTVFNTPIGTIPKGYLYFTIIFSLGLEFINIKINKSKSNN